MTIRRAGGSVMTSPAHHRGTLHTCLQGSLSRSSNTSCCAASGGLDSWTMPRRSLLKRSRS